MNFQAIYIEDTETSNQLCKGGLIIKAGSRSTRQPVHMMLLCDTSGSMEMEDKLKSVQKSITLLLSLLGSEDRISLITFADASKIVLSRASPSAEDRAAIQYRIDSLTPDGSTNMSAGLLDSRSLVEPADSGRKQGIIMLTDGHANIGVMKEEGLVEIVRRIQTESPGVTLTCVAYGVDHNSELLTALAKTGGGAYNVVKNLEDVATVFGDILGGLVSVSAQGVQVQLPPGAEANTPYRCEKDAAGMTTVYIGDIYADSETTILFRNHPSKGPLRVKGTDMATLNPIDEIVQPVVAGLNQPELKPIRITELRQRTADILKEAATTFGSSMAERIDVLMEEIKGDSSIDGHPLKPLLLEDLDEAKKIATKKVARDQYATVEMAQHSAFLSMAKGLRSNTRHVPPNTPLQRSPANFLSPFTTNTQAQYATVMRTASNQTEEDSQKQDEDYA